MGVHEGQDPERRRVVVRDVEQPDLDAVQRLGEVDHADVQILCIPKTSSAFIFIELTNILVNTS